VSRSDELRGALEAVDRVLNRGGDADDVLREVVAVLHERAGYAWAGIRFVEEGGPVLGPSAGDEAAGEGATPFAVSFQGTHVADLEVGGALGEMDRAFLERVALVVSPYALVGWDTGGEDWVP
jgi:hypothetical protein